MNKYDVHSQMDDTNTNRKPETGKAILLYAAIAFLGVLFLYFGVFQRDVPKYKQCIENGCREPKVEDSSYCEEHAELYDWNYYIKKHPEERRKEYNQYRRFIRCRRKYSLRKFISCRRFIQI